VPSGLNKLAYPDDPRQLTPRRSWARLSIQLVMFDNARKTMGCGAYYAPFHVLEYTA
jgi:hypothetical protein